MPFCLEDVFEDAFSADAFSPRLSPWPTKPSDGEVVDMCREHTPFYHAGAYDDKRTNLIIGDAKAGLENVPDASIDVIVCDLSDPLDGGPCYQLYTTSFYAMCKE